MDEVEKHLKRFPPGAKVPCPHPQCSAAALLLPDVIAFKAHTAKVHKINPFETQLSVEYNLAGCAQNLLSIWSHIAHYYTTTIPSV